MSPFPRKGKKLPTKIIFQHSFGNQKDVDDIMVVNEQIE